MLSLKIISKKSPPPPPEFELLLFDAESQNHIENISPPPPGIELLLFDAESENHIEKISPPPPQKLNFYFLMLSLKIISKKSAPDKTHSSHLVPKKEIVTAFGDYLTRRLIFHSFEEGISSMTQTDRRTQKHTKTMYQHR